MKLTQNIQEQHQHKILLLPCWTIGNLPQLTIDLLINSFELEEICSLQHQSLIASVSPPNYNHIITPTLSTTLYGNDTLQCLQLRSTFIASQYELFCDDLSQFIQSLKPSKIIFLHSNANRKGKLHEMTIENKDILDKSPIALHLYSSLQNEFECQIINCVCYDGDNRLLAMKMFDFVLKQLNLNVEMKEMISWNNSTLWGDMDDDIRASMF